MPDSKNLFGEPRVAHDFLISRDKAYCSQVKTFLNVVIFIEEF